MPGTGADVIIDTSTSCNFFTTPSRVPHWVNVTTPVLGAIVVLSSLPCRTLVRITGNLRGASLTVRGRAVVLLDNTAAQLTITSAMVVEPTAAVMGAGTISAASLEMAGVLAGGASLKGACAACYALATQLMGRLSVVTAGWANVTGTLYAKLDSESSFYNATSMPHDALTFTNVAFHGARLRISLASPANLPLTPAVAWTALHPASTPVTVTNTTEVWPWVKQCFDEGVCFLPCGGGNNRCAGEDPIGSPGGPPNLCGSSPGGASILVGVGSCASSACPPGFSGNPCTADCLAAPQCNGHGTCVVGSMAQCACHSSGGFGWSGVRCETPYCPSNCNNGVCQPGPTPQCICTSGYSGALCEVAVCPGGCGSGTCDGGTGTPTCDCSAGWTGSHCETSVTGCPPCVNGGVCNVTLQACLCPPGWRGHSCHLAVCPGYAPGVVANCNGKGTCNTGVMPHVCQCSRGFSGDSCENRADILLASTAEPLPVWAIVLIAVVGCAVVGGLVATSVAVAHRIKAKQRDTTMRRNYVANALDTPYTAL